MSLPLPQISIIIPSAPDRDEQTILANLKKVCPPALEVELFVIKGTWPPLQRNLGIQKARGDYIFFFDDDIIVPPGSIEKALETFKKNPQVQVVGGPNLTPPEDGFLQQCFGETHASYFIALDTAVRYRKVKKLEKVNENHLITCNLAFRSKILKENLFNTEFYANEENELLGRIIRKGNLLAYNPDFFVYHHRRKNLRTYLKQIFKWGEGRTIHTLKQPTHFKIAFAVPLLFLMYLLSIPFINQPLYHGILIVYFILAFIFSLQSALNRKDWRYFLILPELFLLTHVSYALGLFLGFFSYFKTPFPASTAQNFKVFHFHLNPKHENSPL